MCLAGASPQTVHRHSASYVPDFADDLPPAGKSVALAESCAGIGPSAYGQALPEVAPNGEPLTCTAPSQSPAAVIPSTRLPGRLSSYRSDYACGFCAEIGITKTCTRRNDLRRHIDQFHNTNAQWLCQHRGCHMAFDWQTAYQLHLRSEHGGSQMRMDEAKVTLCPQTVFACGYEGCVQVFESFDDHGAAATWKVYTTHLIRHCEEGRGTGRWSYSHRMRNLLRQCHLEAAWESSWSEEQQGFLHWEPSSTRTLRKLLETRHLGDVNKLLGWVVMLGSRGLTTDRPDVDLNLPVKKMCPGTSIKHEARSCPSSSYLSRLHDETRLPSGGVGLGAHQNAGDQQAQPYLATPLQAPGYDAFGHGAAATRMTRRQPAYSLPGPAMYGAPGSLQQSLPFPVPEQAGCPVDAQSMYGVAAAQGTTGGLGGMGAGGGGEEATLRDGGAASDMAAVAHVQHEDWSRGYGCGSGQSPTLTEMSSGLAGSLQRVEHDFMVGYVSPRIS